MKKCNKNLITSSLEYYVLRSAHYLLFTTMFPTTPTFSCFTRLIGRPDQSIRTLVVILITAKETPRQIL